MIKAGGEVIQPGKEKALGRPYVAFQKNDHLLAAIPLNHIHGVFQILKKKLARQPQFQVFVTGI